MNIGHWITTILFLLYTVFSLREVSSVPPRYTDLKLYEGKIKSIKGRGYSRVNSGLGCRIFLSQFPKKELSIPCKNEESVLRKARELRTEIIGQTAQVRVIEGAWAVNVGTWDVKIGGTHIYRYSDRVSYRAKAKKFAYTILPVAWFFYIFSLIREIAKIGHD